jgi:hypothetical protein
MRFREILEAVSSATGFDPNSAFMRAFAAVDKINGAGVDDADPNKPAGTVAKTPAADLSVIQDPDFNKKLQKIASQLGVDSSAILKVMQRESRVNPKAVNIKSGATGLIQFMPKTAISLGTTVEALRQMSAVEQLDYVYLYYKSVGVRPGMDAEDLYLATFMPAAMGKPDNTVLGQKGAGGFSGQVYAQNAGIDKNGTGSITIADIKNFVRSA